MKFVVYRKSDFRIMSTSIETPDESYSPRWEIDNNVIPNHGGAFDDYGYVEITKEQYRQMVDRGCSVQLVDGVPTFITVDIMPSQSPSKLEELETELQALKKENTKLKTENDALKQRDSALQDDVLFIMETLVSNDLA